MPYPPVAAGLPGSRTDASAAGIDRGRTNELAEVEGVARCGTAIAARARRVRRVGAGIPLRRSVGEAGAGLHRQAAAARHDQHSGHAILVSPDDAAAGNYAQL